jgi:SpoVK/Ycf46/Vps4 family AAA+-type ATPase
MAERLHKPLFILDLASVMSSLLGKTGNNLRAALEYAKANDCVLLLDEFDALAKRRNDETEVGELKRLVTVILQEVDRWPAERLLIAATNHGELLDPAIWRRFDAVIKFPMPGESDLRRLLQQELNDEIDENWRNALSILFSDKSFSDVSRSLRSARRQALLRNEPLTGRLAEVIRSEAFNLTKAQQKALGVQLEAAGLSQRQVSEITGLSRDTIRRARSLEVQDG